MRIAENMTQVVGRTPLVRLNRLRPKSDDAILAKLEYMNPGGSVKDRIGVSMIEAAEREGRIGPNTVILEPTSGNTGIALAWVAAAKGYRLILTMPATMSEERRDLLEALGAELILTPAHEEMSGAVRKAQQIAEEIEDVFIPSQFENAANPDAHEHTTGVEIWNDTDGRVDIVVAGIGTGGSIVGIGRALRKRKPEVRMIGVEPAESPLLTKGRSGSHHIQGIGANFVPEVYDADVVDEVLDVPEKEAFRYTRALAHEEGIIAGVSSGAAVAGALRVMSRPENRGKLAVALLPDTGERYLSTWVFRK